MNLSDALRSRLPDGEAPEVLRCLAFLLEEVVGELWGTVLVEDSSKGEPETPFVAILVLSNNVQRLQGAQRKDEDVLETSRTAWLSVRTRNDFVPSAHVTAMVLA